MGIAERQHPIARDHGHDGIGPFAAPMHTADRVKDSRGIEPMPFGCFGKFMSQDVQKNFRIGIGIYVTEILNEHFPLQFLRINEIAVMAKDNAKWRIHVKRLGFIGSGCRPRCWVTAMANSHHSDKITHVACAKDIAHHSTALVHMKGTTVSRDNAGGILATMLQYKKSVIEKLINRTFSNNPNNSTHI